MYLEICDGNMEEGSFRCDANISLRPYGQAEFGTRTELKNMNSFRNVGRALEYEIRRQQAVLDDGDKVIQETRLWNEAKGITESMRGKEESHDYRYFPDPDLIPLQVSPEWIEEIRAGLPELPADKRRRFGEQYGLSAHDVDVLTSQKALADYFEQALEFLQPAQSRGQLDHVRTASRTQRLQMQYRPMSGQTRATGRTAQDDPRRDHQRKNRQGRI